MIENSPYNLYGVDITSSESENGFSLKTIPIMNLHQLKTIKEDKASYFIIFWWPGNPEFCSYSIQGDHQRPLIWLRSNEKGDLISPLYFFLKHQDEFDEIICECTIKMFEEFEPRPEAFLIAWDLRNRLFKHPDDTLEQLLERSKDSMQWLRKN